jgi:hypothetical protein
MNDNASGKNPYLKKRTPVGCKRLSGFLFLAAALCVLYYVNFVLPESALTSGKRRGLLRTPPATVLTKEQIDDIVKRGVPTNIGTPEDPPREPNTAICNESVLEGVMSVARQQSDRATKMYEDERKRREKQDVELSAALQARDDLLKEVEELKEKLKSTK